MIKGVFFDLYGTLLIYGDMVAAYKDQISAFQRFVVRKGYTISTDMLSSYYQNIMKRPTQPTLDESSIFERQLEDICNEIGVRLTGYETSELAEVCVCAWQKHIQLDPQTAPLLRQLRQTSQTALITNFDHPPHINQVLRELELSALFDAIIISGSVGLRKPDHRIFEMALRATALSAYQVIFVGDSQEDIQGAIAAGMQPVYIRRPSTNNPDASLKSVDAQLLSQAIVITDLRELTGLVNSL